MRRALVAFALGAAGSAACSSEPAQPSGLFVVVSSPDVYATSDFETLEISVGGKVVQKAVTQLPTSISVVGAPGTEAKVEVRALLHGVVRLATYAKTTIPSGRFAVLPLTFAAACRDRCVQVGVDEPLTSYCDATNLECVHETVSALDPAKLATYDPSHDPTVGLAPIDCGGGAVIDPQTCNGADVGALGCPNVSGEGSTGDLSCVSCRGVTSSTCSGGNGLSADAPWPTAGGSNLHQGRTSIVGPKTAPLQPSPLNAQPIGGVMSPPVVDKSGTVWFTTNGLTMNPALAYDARAGVVVAVRGSVVTQVFQPDWVIDCKLDPNKDERGSAGCRWSAPVLADDGAVYATTNVGTAFRFTTPDPNGIPIPTFDLGVGCAGQADCNVTQLGFMFRDDPVGRLAYLPSGGGFFVFKANKNGLLSSYSQPFAVNAPCATWGHSMPAVDRKGTFYVPVNPVFATNSKPGICALDAHGLLKWHSPETEGNTRTPTIGVDGTVYFGGDDHLLHAIDPAAPSKFKWSAATGGATTSASLGVDGTLYVGSTDQNLYAFDADGSQKWAFRAKGAVSATPLVDGDGTIYFGTEKGIVYAVNPNGTLLWRATAGSAINAPAALTPDGTLYVGSEEGFVFAFPSQ